jgi:hypothetical protein
VLFEFIACLVRISFARANPKFGQYDNKGKPTMRPNPNPQPQTPSLNLSLSLSLTLTLSRQADHAAQLPRDDAHGGGRA